MAYSTVDDVRNEAGDPHPSDVTDELIQAKIDAADIIINNTTRHTWVEGIDESYPLVVLVSELLASSFIMDAFDDPKGEADKNFDKGMMLLQLLTSEDNQSGDINIAVTEYLTPQLNPSVGITRGRLTQTTVGEDVLDYL